MKNTLSILFLLILLSACNNESPTIDLGDEILNVGTRASLISAEEQEAFNIKNQLQFLTIQSTDGQKSSTLGNGKYFNYLRVTFRLTAKQLYQKEIVEARQICIREMMHTHYASNKEEVMEEITKILAGDILMENEKRQVNIYLEYIVSGVYENVAIQFECSNPVDCLT